VNIFKREQLIAVAALAVFVVTCITFTALSIQSRFNASQELSDGEDLLSRLESHSASSSNAGGPRKDGVAPMNAFLDAPTIGLAGADLQAYVERLASQHAAVVSFSIQPSAREDSSDTVRIEASLDISLSALQLLLYQLEGGAPYVFVESMTVRPAATGASLGGTDSLRVTLGLRALWRRSAA
jgi:general secretion pathway protein M